MTKEKKQRQVSIGLAILIVAGLAAFVHGVALAWLPGAWMMTGLFAVVPALLIAYDQFRSGVK